MDQAPQNTITPESNGQPSARSATRPRGFAALSPERMREIASQGGKKAHRLQRAHKWTAAEAKEAGRLGGKAAQAKRTKEENREAARLGGKAAQAQRSAARSGAVATTKEKTKVYTLASGDFAALEAQGSVTCGVPDRVVPDYEGQSVQLAWARSAAPGADATIPVLVQFVGGGRLRFTRTPNPEQPGAAHAG